MTHHAPPRSYRAAAAQLPHRCGAATAPLRLAIWPLQRIQGPGFTTDQRSPARDRSRLMDSNADWDELSLGTSRISFGENRSIKTPAETSRGQSALTRQHTDKARAPTWRPPACSRPRLGEDSEKSRRRLGEDSEKTRRRLGEDSEKRCE
jgi:hypothetical protein